QLYLDDPAPEIRIAGAGIVGVETADGNVQATQTWAKLLDMMTNDPSLEVRAAVIEALGYDSDNVPSLLHQLAVEKNSDLKVALLAALSPRQSPSIVQVALPLLKDQSLRVAQAAADLIAAAGQALRQPNEKNLASQCENALMRQFTGRSTGPDAEALRESVVRALGELGDMGLEGLFQKLAYDQAESNGVRAMAIMALGNLASQNWQVANVYAPFVDPSQYPAELRLAAAHAMAMAKTTAFVNDMVDKINLHPDPDVEVRDAIWETVQTWFPLMSLDDLSNLADRLKNENDSPHEAEVLRALSQRLITSNAPGAQADAAARLETLAYLELQNLNRPDLAAQHFNQACAIYENLGQGLPPSPFKGEADALLALGPPYDQAVQYAIQVLTNPKLQGIEEDVMGEYAQVADNWSQPDNNRKRLQDAVTLVDALEKAGLPKKLPATLNYIWSEQLDQARANAKQYLAQ
ncbi:MAG TPA: hypothetical protein VMD30_01785, partial [Tepidisphaeraceae bacterium]|nr:hypothetical protein [Tepidisphaeraceae bacterium]